ncbi:MAG TPA: 3-methyl-2-oxobutanoate hydroxymethyltransferase [Abditibacteriaceae bacterium]|jgi:3-methyl-2-oxobutanoate hydroxymethyltransferase
MPVSPSQILRDAKARGERIAMISLYDAPTARLCCDAGADILLVGDSMGNVVLGYDNTVPVTMNEILVHTAAVVRGARQSTRPTVPIVADLPFGSYISPTEAAHNAAELVRAGAHGVKLEGAGATALAATRAIVEMGAPVIGHLGFTPQLSAHFGSVVQAKTGDTANKLLDDAHALQEAGCCAIVLEVVPAEVAARATQELQLSTIGIGAGVGCDGQVLVWHDMVGLSGGKPFRFVKRYLDAHEMLIEATRQFVGEVHEQRFPTDEHSWKMSPQELQKWQDETNGSATE